MAHGQGHDDDEVTLDVGTPKGLFTGTFPKTAKVEHVIEAAVNAKGIDSGESLELVYNGKVLQPAQRTLVSFGLAGTVKLELVATGSGV
jgi:exopolysaccharide biosynthesis protein